MNDHDRLVVKVERLKKERDAMTTVMNGVLIQSATASCEALAEVERLTRERDEALDQAQEITAELAEERTLVQALWQAIRDHRGAERQVRAETGRLHNVTEDFDRRLWAAVPGLTEETP